MRYIQQGDLLFPYLFVACMERLSHLIEEAVNTKARKPIRVCRNGPLIARLLFADDVVFFSAGDFKPSSHYSELLREILSSLREKGERN